MRSDQMTARMAHQLEIAQLVIATLWMSLASALSQTDLPVPAGGEVIVTDPLKNYILSSGLNQYGSVAKVSEDAAAWRQAAKERIDQIRKSELVVDVRASRNRPGTPIQGSETKVLAPTNSATNSIALRDWWNASMVNR